MSGKKSVLKFYEKFYTRFCSQGTKRFITMETKMSWGNVFPVGKKVDRMHLLFSKGACEREDYFLGQKYNRPIRAKIVAPPGDDALIKQATTDDYFVIRRLLCCSNTTPTNSEVRVGDCCCRRITRNSAERNRWSGFYLYKIYAEGFTIKVKITRTVLF